MWTSFGFKAGNGVVEFNLAAGLSSGMFYWVVVPLLMTYP